MSKQHTCYNELNVEDGSLRYILLWRAHTQPPASICHQPLPFYVRFTSNFTVSYKKYAVTNIMLQYYDIVINYTSKYRFDVHFSIWLPVTIFKQQNVGVIGFVCVLLGQFGHTETAQKI